MATTKSAPFTRPSGCTTAWKSAFPRPGRELTSNATTRRSPAGRAIWFTARARRGRRLASWRGGIRVQIEKAIPLGSGLGGASTNAAATILGLERLTGDRLDFPARHKLAAALGSDVPLFFLGGRVLGCGRGEEVYPLSDLPSRHCLVVFPGFSVSTAEAYREAGLRLTEQAGTAYIGSFGAWPQFPLMSWGPAENDFEHVVFARWPELARLKRRLIRAGAEVASLTGSGSAVYALFSSSRQMARASKLIPKGWLVISDAHLGARRLPPKAICSLSHRVIESLV